MRITQSTACIQIGLCLLLIGGISAGRVGIRADAAPRSYRVSTYGTLQLPALPADWVAANVTSRPPQLARFSLPAGRGRVTLSLLPPFGNNGYTLDRLHNGALLVRKGHKKEAEGGKVRMGTLPGRGNKGYWTSYRKVMQDEDGYLYRTSCAVILDRMSLNLVAHHREESDAFFDTLMTIARTASITPFHEWTLQLPAATWALSLDVEGYEVSPESSRTRLLATTSSGISLSAFLEPDHAGATPEHCRQLYTEKLQQSPLLMDSPADSSYLGMAIHEYTFVRIAGQRIQQKHIHAHIAHDGVCIEIHVSKVRFREKHRDSLLNILESVTLIEDAASAHVDAGT